MFSSQAAPSFSFGANKPASSTGTGSGLFGNANTSSSQNGAFGSTLFSNNNSNNNNNTGNVGSSSAPLFGNNNATTNSSTGGLFGSGATGGTGLFKSATSTGATAAPSGGLFGNNNNNTQAPTTTTASTGGGLFGTSNNNSTGTGLFGGASNNTTAGSTGGLFGSSNNTSSTGGGLFGGSTATAPATGGAGLFGNSNNNNNATTTGTTGGGLFGTAGTSQPSTGGGLFGNTSSTASAPSGGLFGNSGANNAASSTGGLFGGGASSTGGGLFSKPATSAQAPSSGIFSNNNSSSNNTSNPSGLFGSNSNPSANQAQPATTNALVPLSAGPPLPALTVASDKYKKPASSFSRVSKNISSLKAKSRYALSAARSNPYSASQRSDINSRDLFLKSVAANPKLTKTSFFSEGRRSDIKKLVISRRAILPEDIRGVKTPLLLENKDTTSNSILEATPVKKIEANTTVNSPRTHTPLKRVYEINKTAEDEGYWIYPPLKELFSYGFDQLSAVPDLAIGRKGHGKLQFASPVNLSEIRNLGDIMGNLVVFDGTTVCVYPNDKEKAPEGTQLNVPATVTLENIFIKHVVGGRTITVKDPTSPRAVRHMSILRHNIEKRGGEFITYDVEHGIFVFKVPHFSTWGFVDDDLLYDENDLDMAEAAPEPKESESILRLNINSKNNGSISEDTFANGLKHKEPAAAQDLGQLRNQYEYEFPAAPSQYSESESGATEKDQKPVQVPESALDLVGHTEAEDISIDNYDTEAVSSGWVQQLEYASDISSVFAKFNSHSGFSAVDLDSTLFGGLKSLNENSTTAQYAVAAEKLRLVPAFKPHTFAVFSGNDLVLRDSSSPSGFKIASKVSFFFFFFLPHFSIFSDILLTDQKSTKKSSVQVLDALLKASTFSPRANGLPKATPTSEVTFSYLVSSLGKESETRLWDLATILFNDLPELDAKEFSPAARERIKQQQRAKRLSDWLKYTTEADMLSLIEGAQNPLEVAYAYLSGGQISRAAVAAAEGKNLHLATLIPLLGTNDLSIRRTAQAQLNDWANSGSLDLVPREVRKIHELLVGNTTVSAAGTPYQVNMCESLSWLQALGMKLWYSTTVNEDLSIAVKEYEEAFNNAKLKVPSPAQGNHLAVEFELLKLYGSIDPVPRRAFDAAQDAWTAWVLYHILFRSLGLFKDTENLGDTLSISLALELEQSGHIGESIFVLSYLDDDELALSYMQDVLGRNVTSINGDIRSLLKRIGLNESFVYESQALYSRYEGDHVSECKALLSAGAFEEAHNVLITFVAPAAVVANHTSEVFDIILSFKNPEKTVTNWALGGKIYLDYIRFVEKMSPSAAALNDSALPKTTAQELAESLVKGLKEITVTDTTRFEVRVAVSLMKTYVSHLLTTIGVDVGSDRLMNVGTSEAIGDVRDMSVSYFASQCAA